MSNNLENQAPADTFKSLLQTGNNDGVQGIITPIQDGAGVDTALAISTISARVNGAFAVTGNSDVSGDLTVAGDFTVNGTTTTINTQTLEIEDETLVIASNVDHTQLVQPSGILWGDNANPPQLTYQDGVGFSFSGGNVGIFAAVKPVITLFGSGNNVAGTNFGEIQFYNSDDSADGPNVAASIHAQSTSDTGSGGSLVFSTENSHADGEGRSADPRMVINQLGNVGIGTTNPSKVLEVQLTDNTAYTDGVTSNSLKLRNLSQSADSYSGIELSAGQLSGGQVHIARIYGVKQSTTTPATSLVFATRKDDESVTEKMRIGSDGSVGIGTTSPGRTLHVVDATTDGSGGIKVQNYKPVVELLDANETGTATTLTQDETNFTIANDGVDSLTIDSDGQVGICTTTPTAKLEIMSGVNAFPVTDISEDQATSLRVAGSDNAVIDMGTNGGTGTWIQARNKVTDNLEYTLSINPLGGNVGIGTTTPSAPLEVASTTGGVILPRMTGAEMNAIANPTAGEMVFNTTDSTFYGYNGTSWVALH